MHYVELCSKSSENMAKHLILFMSKIGKNVLAVREYKYTSET